MVFVEWYSRFLVCKVLMQILIPIEKVNLLLLTKKLLTLKHLHNSIYSLKTALQGQKFKETVNSQNRDLCRQLSP